MITILDTVYYVTNEKPKSHNKGGADFQYKKKHSDRFQNKYAHLYTGLPTREIPLQSQLVYIYHNLNSHNIPDVDNLSKPIIDAFTNVIYYDDSQVARREADIIELKELQFITIDYTNMPTEIATDILDFIDNQETHIVLLTIGNLKWSNIKIGEI